MVQSMTAFSRIQQQADSATFSWELRSVNHRYLDISFRLPEQFRYMEPIFRNSIRGKITRGKLDLQLKLDDAGVKNSLVVIDEDLVTRLLSASTSLAYAHHLADDIKLSHVLSWPGVIREKLPVFDNLASLIERSFKEALEKLIIGRRSEGAVLAENLNSRLQLLAQELVSAQKNTTLITVSAREKLLKRLDELQMNVADTRLEQELALILTRLDVSEEIERLNAHIHEVQRTLDSEEPSGRRLDFLMQELNREANTLSSKSDSLILSQHALQMKVLIDQMREQIQNIE
jgi:uncharacterized protein (TIGR00255 family)